MPACWPSRPPGDLNGCLFVAMRFPLLDSGFEIGDKFRAVAKLKKSVLIYRASNYGAREFNGLNVVAIKRNQSFRLGVVAVDLLGKRISSVPIQAAINYKFRS